MTEKTELEPLPLHSVGIVHSRIERPMLTATEAGLTLSDHLDKIRETHRRHQQAVAELEIDPALTGILDGVEGFSHLLVLYWPHQLPEERRGLRRVHPMGRRDLPEQGIFATCSPARPNPVLVTAVRLLERKDNVLFVRGLDAVDGSPIVDIKPYVHYALKIEGTTVPEWMERIHREMAEEEGPEVDG